MYERFKRTQDLIYKAKDRYITAGAVSDDEWRGMCRALNREDLINDERFSDSSSRMVNAQKEKRTNRRRNF